MAVRLDDDLRNDLLLLGMPNFGTGTIKIYTGAQPASANDAPTGTLLATFTLNGFNAPVAGARSLNVGALTQPVSAAATGVAGWARMESTDGSPRVLDMDVSESGGGGDLIINNESINTSDDVSIVSFSLTMPAS